MPSKPIPQIPVNGKPLERCNITLSIVTGPHRGGTVRFESHETLVVGRARDVQWRLALDPHFSRYHFRIEAHPPRCRLTDLDSTNGTFVNGQRVRETDLHHDDEIQCGETKIRVAVVHPAGSDDATSAWPSESDSRTLDFPAPPQVPEVLADFRILREIGHGAMGIVYQAVHQPSGRPAAVKVIRPANPATYDAQQLFLREASILSQLRHRHIVQYLSLGLHERQMYLAMEYVPAMNLRQLLAGQKRPAQFRMAVGIVCKVLEALEYAHQRNIVHRDVKLSNILVYRSKRGLGAKLGDFGLAKNYLNAGFSCISREDQVRGTLAYMAPEQLINCRYAKPAADLYAAGACLYCLLSDRMPYDLEDGASAVARILNTPPVPLRQRAADVPAELAAAVDRSLERDPGSRFASAGEMRKTILRFSQP